MTDGGLYYDANGLVMKRFHVLDGIRLAKTAGIEVVLSGMDVPCVVETAGSPWRDRVSWRVMAILLFWMGCANGCPLSGRKSPTLEMIGSISHQCPAWGLPLPYVNICTYAACS